MGHYRIPDLIIKLFIPCIMLTKGIAGKQNLVLFQIGKHAVGPMEHPCLQKSQGSFTQTQLSTGFNCMVIQFLLKMARKVFIPHFGTVYGFFFSDPMHHQGQTAGMIHLSMIADDIVNLFGINNLRNIFHEFIEKFLFNGIDQDYFLIYY